MLWNLVYFDDQIENIECFQMLLNEKFDVFGCTDLKHYSEILFKNAPHACLIDVHMPEMSGHALYEKIISNENYNGCPIIFISGDVANETKLRSYDYGGVDFLTRDMDAEEIEARISSKIKLFLKTTNKLTFGNLVIDFESLKVSLSGRLVDITLFELRIMSSVIRTLPGILTREELLQKIWGSEASKPGTINTHISSIKAKLYGWDYTIQIRQENILVLKKSVE